ncbi:unnamed protein product [Brugia timori]|uniref:Uncharacterized protein n=1 Tax=Brugia timori TaxID=42155 RepID=A0A0R3QA55_9BILA|nr:unnamed protein product [Brugia timori]
MDFDDSYCYLENNFNQFHLMNLLSPSDSGINLDSTNEQRNDQLSTLHHLHFLNLFSIVNELYKV